MTIQKHYIFSRSNFILLILYLIPILSVCGFVSYFSVNVPLDDQWIVSYLSDRVFRGNLTFKDLFDQHNSHRILFPKLIFIALSFASNWNIKWELYLSVILALLTFLSLYSLSLVTAKKYKQTPFNLINLSTCFLLFSWVQHKNWLWGFQIALFLINFCVVLSCLVLSSEFIKPKIKLLLSALLCGIASFSSLQGLLSWLAVIPSVLILEGDAKTKKKRLLIWIFLFLSSIFLYSIGYKKETDTVPNPVSSDNKILAILHFFFNLIAAPFLEVSTLTWILGFVMALSFLGLTFFAIFYSKFKEEQASLFPWISIGFFSLFCGSLIAIGRSGLGADYAILASRYTTHLILLPIAMIQLSQRILLISSENMQVKLRQGKIFLLYFCMGILIGLNLIKSVNVVPYLQYRVPFTQLGKTCLSLIEYLEPSSFLKVSELSCLRQLNTAQWTEFLWDSAEKLKRLNFRTFAENLTFIEDPDQTYGEILTPQTDKVLNISKSESVKIRGWVERSSAQDNPTLILFSLNNKTSFFANTYAVDWRSQPFTSKKSSSEFPLEWEVELTADFLPLETRLIQAWIYDSTQNQFLKLDHQVNLKISNAQFSE